MGFRKRSIQTQAIRIETRNVISHASHVRLADVTTPMQEPIIWQGRISAAQAMRIATTTPSLVGTIVDT